MMQKEMNCKASSGDMDVHGVVRDVPTPGTPEHHTCTFGLE
jgi:hypothetical protein